MVDSRQEAKRSWVVLLYFYLAALAGLGFVITGLTMGLLGAKNALLPALDLPRYTYEQGFYPGATAPPAPPTDKQLQDAKARAIDERRNSGLNSVLDGLIIAGVGAPVLIWHLKRAREPSSPQRITDLLSLENWSGLPSVLRYLSVILLNFGPLTENRSDAIFSCGSVTMQF